MKKNIIKLSAIVFAASALAVSCEKNFEGEAPAEQTNRITFTAQMPETRTVFGEYDGASSVYPVFWQNGDKVHIFTKETDNSGGNYSIDDNIATAVTTDGGKTATLSLDIPASTRYYAVTPAECMEYFYKTPGEYDLFIDNYQKPLKDCCDPKVQIIYGCSSEVAADDTNVSIKFLNHVTAYGKFKFENFEGVSNDDIALIVIEAGSKDAKLTERYELHWDGKNAENPFRLVSWGTSQNSIILAELQEIKGREYFWFGCAPIEFEDLHTSLTFTVTTSDKIYTKTIEADDNWLFFEAGSVTAFALDMSKGVEVKNVAVAE